MGQGEKDWLEGASGTGEESDLDSLSTSSKQAGGTSTEQQDSESKESDSLSSSMPPDSTESSTSDQEPGPDTKEAETTSQSQEEGSTGAVESFACGLQVTKVSVNQSVEIPLSDGPELLPADGDRRSVWTGRRSLFRIYLKATKPILSPVRVVLELANGERLWQREEFVVLLGSASNALDLSSTVNFIVPKKMISEQSEFRVRVYQPGSCSASATDLPAVPKKGRFALGATKAPSMQLQFVRARYSDQSDVAPLDLEFMSSLRSELLARFPLAQVEFDPRDELQTILAGSVQGGQDLGAELLAEVVKLREETEQATSPVHYVGLANFSKSLEMLGDAPSELEGGVALVDVRGKEERLIERILRTVGRLHGLSEDDCSKGASSSQAPGKIGAWGFDGPRDGFIHPNRYEDVSCKLSGTPSWIHPTSYLQFADRARELVGE